MKFIKFDMVDVNKEGEVTDLCPVWVLATEIIGVSAMVDMHEVVVKNVTNIMTKLGTRMCVEGEPSSVVEMLEDKSI